MRRISIFISVFSILVFVLFWSCVFGLTRFFPNSEKSLKRPYFKSSVSIVKDSYGVPLIEGENQSDVLKAQGLITARDRFFQMELIRRKMSGRLSELFGEKAYAIDLWHRRIGFTRVARLAAEQMREETREVWNSYVQGVNDYLENETVPWEVKVLGYRPEPWRIEDGLLVVLSMFEALNDPDNSEELAYNELYRQFSKSVVNFVTWDFGFLDAPAKAPKNFPFPIRIPTPAEINFRSQARNMWTPKLEEKEVFGSNAWVVSGSKTLSGKPLLAGDPHLNLTVPNIWHRSELKFQGRSVRGVSVPGIPGVIIGRNDKIAWSFTNSRADVQDYIHFERKQIPLTERVEVVVVKGNGNQTVTFLDSPHGPVIEEAIEKGPKTQRILQWTALDSAVLSQLNPLELDLAQNLDQCWDAMSRWAGPVQNILVATRDNHIAWAMVGKIPEGRKESGKVSQTLAQGAPWKGYVAWQKMPKVVDPSEGFIGNGNQNMWAEVPGREIWGHDWPSPARGFQVRSLLSKASGLSADAMESIQNDIYSPVHLWYRDRLIEAIHRTGERIRPLDSSLDVITRIINDWDGKVSKDSRAYPFLKEFRLQVLKNCTAPFVKLTATYRQDAVQKLIAKDNLVYHLLTHRPLHLLNPKFESWDELLLSSAVEAAGELAQEPNDLYEITWGKRNRLQVQHPFSSQFPKLLSQLIDLPERELDGDGLVIRVNKPKNGASMRMIIDMAEDKNSKFSQPGGQSGYFLSPNYRDLFESWYLGQGVSFESGYTESKQMITP